MSIEYYRGLCQRYHGRGVEIRTHSGEIYRGVIEDVDDSEVYLLPIECTRNLGGFGYGFRGFGGFGPYGGYGPYRGYDPYGRGYRVALGAIAGISLLSLFFW